MFFGADRILAMRQMILSPSEEERRVALGKILPYQREDFTGILRAMSPFPVTIRLLDPPLHEFLPHTEQEITELSSEDRRVGKEGVRKCRSRWAADYVKKT